MFIVLSPDNLFITWCRNCYSNAPFLLKAVISASSNVPSRKCDRQDTLLIKLSHNQDVGCINLYNLLYQSLPTAKCLACSTGAKHQVENNCQPVRAEPAFQHYCAQCAVFPSPTLLPASGFTAATQNGHLVCCSQPLEAAIPRTTLYEVTTPSHHSTKLLLLSPVST